MIFLRSALFIVLGLMVFPQTPATNLFERPAPQKSEDSYLEDFPLWLIQQSFRIRQRLEFQFDGSEAAHGIVKRSETREELIFQDLDHWRVRRVIPFQSTSLELLKRPEGFYTVSNKNRTIPSHRAFSPEIWTALVKFPYELSRRWGFFVDADTWAKWFQEISQLKEPLQNAEGDTLRITYREEDGVRHLRLNLEGSYLYEGNLQLRLRGEWEIELGREISEQMLQTALAGGSD